MYYYCSTINVHIFLIEKFPSLNGDPTKRQRVSATNTITLISNMSPTVFIIGASRGIGRGLVDTFLHAGWDVHATVRTTNVTLLPSVVTHVLDVENNEQIEQVAKVSMVTRSTYLYTMLASSHLIRYRTISASI